MNLYLIIENDQSKFVSLLKIEIQIIILLIYQLENNNLNKILKLIIILILINVLHIMNKNSCMSIFDLKLGIRID